MLMVHSHKSDRGNQTFDRYALFIKFNLIISLITFHAACIVVDDDNFIFMMSVYARKMFRKNNGIINKNCKRV